MCTPAGFPLPAHDGLGEAIDLAAWLVEHLAASYIMLVEGRSMAGAVINDGDLITWCTSVHRGRPRKLLAPIEAEFAKRGLSPIR